MTLAFPAAQPMTGRQKLAIVFMAVGPEITARLGAELTPDEVEQISLEIAQTERVPAEVTEQVLTEWLEATLGIASLSIGGMEFAREVLERAYGKMKADQMVKRIQNQLSDTVGMPRLRKLDPQQLATTLRGEHPQTAALVLSHLEPAHTAAIIRELPPTFGGEVLYRMAKMEKVAPDMLQLVERALSSDTDLTFTTGMAAAGGPAAVASVLNLVSGALEKEFIEGFSERDATLAEQIKNLMFVFEDLVALDDKSLQRLLREVDAKQLALALKAASEELKGKILGSMSQRAVAALKEEMEFMGPVRMRDVETAQTTIVTQVRKLEETGEIVLSAGGDDVLV